MPGGTNKKNRFEITAAMKKSYENGIMDAINLIGENIPDDIFEDIVVELLPQYKDISLWILKSCIENGNSPISERLHKIKSDVV